MNRTIIEYIVVYASSPDSLACKVNDQIGNNYEIYGNLVTTATQYLQTMVRYE